MRTTLTLLITAIGIFFFWAGLNCLTTTENVSAIGIHYPNAATAYTLMAYAGVCAIVGVFAIRKHLKK